MTICELFTDWADMDADERLTAIQEYFDSLMKEWGYDNVPVKMIDPMDPADEANMDGDTKEPGEINSYVPARYEPINDEILLNSYYFDPLFEDEEDLSATDGRTYGEAMDDEESVLTMLTHELIHAVEEQEGWSEDHRSNVPGWNDADSETDASTFGQEVVEEMLRDCESNEGGYQSRVDIPDLDWQCKEGKPDFPVLND